MVRITAIRNWIKNGCNLDDLMDLGIQVKRYLPINKKLTLIHRMLAYATVESDGMQSINTIYKHLFYEIEMVRAYSNLDFSTVDKLRDSEKLDDREKYGDKLIEYYDMIKSAGIVDYILGLIADGEVQFIKNCLEEQIIENNRVNNSIAGVVGGALNRLIDRLPTADEMDGLLKSLPSIVNNLDPKILANVLDIVKFNNPSTVKVSRDGK